MLRRILFLFLSLLAHCPAQPVAFVRAVWRPCSHAAWHAHSARGLFRRALRSGLGRGARRCGCYSFYCCE